MRSAFIVASCLAALLAPTAGMGQASPQKQEVKPPRAYLKKLHDAVTLFTEKEDADGSIQALKPLAQQQPDFFEVHAWLGYVQLRSGRTAESVPSLERARAIRPGNEDTLVNLAVAYTALNRSDSVVSIYTDLVELQPANPSYQANLGAALLADNRPQEALVHLERAHEAAPDDPTILANLARASVQSGNSDKAEAHFRRVLSLDTDRETRATALAWLGYYSLQDENYAEAVTSLEEAASLRENDLEILNNLAHAYARSNPPRRAEAARLYRRMSELDSDQFTPWYNLSVLSIESGDADEAVRAGEEALKRKPGDAHTLNNLAKAYSMKGDDRKAADAYGKAADAEPSNAVFQRNAGAAYAAIGDADRASKYIERSMSMGESDPAQRQALASVRLRQGRYDEAIRLLEGMEGQVGNNPKDQSTYWYNLGYARQQGNDLPGARTAYEKALALTPDDQAVLRNLSSVYMAQNDYDATLPVFLKLSQIDQNDMEAKLNLAAVMYRSGRTAEAVEFWKQFIRANPGRSDVRLNLANALWDLQDFDGARFHWRTVLKQDPNNAEANNGVGLYQLRASENKAAEQSFRTAISARPDFMPPYNNLAVTLERQNRRKEAIQALEKALSINPGFDAARRNLDRMKKAESGG